MIEIILIVAVLVLALALVCCYFNKRQTPDEVEDQRRQQAKELRDTWAAFQNKAKDFDGTVVLDQDNRIIFAGLTVELSIRRLDSRTY